MGARAVKGHALFRKRDLTFIPASRDAREMLGKLKDGATVMMEIWHPRNMAQHRKYFAILNNVVEATGQWVSAEHLRRDILLNLGRYEQFVDRFTGEVHKVPHSMKVASMSKEDFERLYDDTIKLLTDALGCDPEMLLEEAA